LDETWELVSDDADFNIGDSAKNRFGNRKLMIKDRVSAAPYCIEAGDKVQNLSFNIRFYEVGVSGSSC
jgi:hypothetical protein